MKYSTLIAATVPAVASAQWWNGAPECAQSCLSSAWAGPTSTTTSWWPQQSEYCDEDSGSTIGNCISDACSATATAYTSRANNHLLRWSCDVGHARRWGGKLFPSGHGPGNGNGGAGQWGGPNGTDYSQYWSDWASAYSGSKTWTGGVVTVTGCAFDGSPWFVGPNCGWNGLGGFNGFVGWGSGWSWGPTQTQTITVTTTDSSGQQTTETGVGTVAVAVSGTLTTSSIVGVLAQETSSSTSEPNAANRMSGPGPEGSIVTVFLGLGLGAVVAVAGML
ncbi:hypothetical protein E0Z10_g10595 [Xylaria hypoxylon]|uniref:Uncharacterized protein n=1 Tax=Xylaria hypoxylon TaxID=37992 RepID=A0A4Z0YNF6_9PEZI|nr:hypothetical protein E0Z10_g10595 [Xylaria hypoxylon]